MHECIKKKVLGHLIEDQSKSRPKCKWVRGRGNCLEGEKKIFYRERSEKNEFDFTLDIYIEIAAQWIEELSRSVKH